MKQRVKKIINWILIVAVILVIGFFYAFVRKDRAVFTAPAGMSAYNGHDIVCDFECSSDMLAGMKIQFASNADKSGTINYYLLDSEGIEATESESTKIKSLKTDKYTLLKLDKIKDSKNKKYTFAISCDNKMDEGVTVLENTQISYSYIEWDSETMIVFCLGALYLAGLSKLLMWMFRK